MLAAPATTRPPVGVVFGASWAWTGAAKNGAPIIAAAVTACSAVVISSPGRLHSRANPGAFTVLRRRVHVGDVGRFELGHVISAQPRHSRGVMPRMMFQLSVVR